MAKIISVAFIILVITGVLVWKLKPQPPLSASPTPSQSSFSDDFSQTYTLEEAKQDKIYNPNWWLNSGAYFFSGEGVGKTVFGNLPTGSKWQTAYHNSNPEETEDGMRPQNIFRLVTRGQWQNLSQEVYFNIQNYNLSTSQNRQASNGLFLFNRYQDGDNLYYTGLRVDGTASIKKKYHGVYYEMGNKQVVSGAYSKDTSPNLLPAGQWIGLRSEVYNNTNGLVTIILYLDLTNSNDWEKVLVATDDGKSFGGPIISQAGHTGIRTDFMDAEFKNYSISESAK